MTLREVIVRAPAKINLCLGVGPLRPDGFHPLATVYQAVGLYDEVRVRPAVRHGHDTLTVTGHGVDVSHVPTDGSNLVLRAARLLADRYGLEGGVDAHVVKRIPVAGGLAGGSTDGAAALLACAALWELDTATEALTDLAAELGSDVPFCLLGGTAAGSGRGEVVAPVPTAGTYWWLIIPADGGLSTPAVYREFDRLSRDTAVSQPEIPPGLLTALSTGDVKALGAALSNDLEQAAFSLRPDLAEIVTAGLDGGAHGAIVTGSGPTTVYLCESREHAERVDASLQQNAGTQPGLVAPSPVAGARVVGMLR